MSHRSSWVAVAVLILVLLGSAYAIVASNQPATGSDEAPAGFLH